MSVLLVIACSGFARRFRDPEYDAGRTLYLRQQHRALSSLQYSCDVVFVNSGGETPEYCEYMDFLRGEYRVLDRENRGMSLGAFSAAWRATPDYDYYILLEDDYMFVLDHFDEEMTGLMQTLPDCGYLCQLTAPEWQNSTQCDVSFPSFMNGIASSALMTRLGGITGENEPSGHPTGDEMQKSFGAQIMETRQFTLADMGSRFRAPFAETRGRECYITEYYPDAPYLLIVPSQMYTRDV